MNSPTGLATPPAHTTLTALRRDVGGTIRSGGRAPPPRLNGLLDFSALEILFDGCARTDASATREHPGTGLGLSICTWIGAATGGTLWVERAATAGLPLLFAMDSETAGGPSDSETHNERTDDAPRPRRVLLAEDNLVNQEMTGEVLDRMGHEIKVVENGREALDAVQAQNFDIVLMDVQMPEMDGVEATRRIRAAQPRAGQPHIVALTAAATAEVRRRCFEAGMDVFLSKPVRQEELAEAFAQGGT